MDMKLSATQKQTLSPKMIQSAEILQMNNQELEAFVKEQEMENPLVEIEHAKEETDRMSDIQRKLEWLNAMDEQNRVYYGAERDEARKNCELIRSLNPKPGNGFSSRENLHYIRPDVTVVKFQDYFQILLNDSAYYVKNLLRWERSCPAGS